jgi:hypothetical protein
MVDKVYKGDTQLWPYDWSALSLYVNTVGTSGPIGNAMTGQSEEIWEASWERTGNGYAGLATAYGRSAWLANNSSPSWECDVLVDEDPSWGNYVLIAASAGPQYAYYFELRYGRVQLFKRVGASFYWLTNHSVDLVVSPGDWIGVRMVESGTDLVVSALHNGVLKQTMVDSSPLSPLPTYVEVNSNDTGVRISHVRAGDIGTLDFF